MYRIRDKIEIIFKFWCKIGANSVQDGSDWLSWTGYSVRKQDIRRLNRTLDRIMDRLWA